MDSSNANDIIQVDDLLYELDDLLVSLLQSLNAEDWHRSTYAGEWTVKDIASHLLDGNIRSLSMLRDGYFSNQYPVPESYEELVALLNRLNREWVSAFRRVSPGILIGLLEDTGKAYCDFIRTLDPFAKAVFAVDWAGEQASLNWFHVAREYTEKWHHQMQMRVAVNRTAALLDPRFYLPYLETSMRALPYHYRKLKAREGSRVHVAVREVAPAGWTINYNKGWQLERGRPDASEVNATVELEPDIAWRIFTKGIDKKSAMDKSRIAGDHNLAMHLFDMLAVMA